MKILQVVPRPDTPSKLKSLLKKQEIKLRGKGTTFSRQKEGRWKHKTYPGWINWDEAPGGILVAEIQSKVEGTDWQLLQAFVGYLQRHLGKHIESITIYFR
jgi:hypothetical protein